MSDDSLNPKFVVSFIAPLHSWMNIHIEHGKSVFDLTFDDILANSLLDLTQVIAAIWNGRRDGVVIQFYSLPIYYEFHLASRNEDLILHVIEYPHVPNQLGMGSDGKSIFEVRDNRIQICLTFWRALRKLQSQSTPEHYAEHWKHPFPVEQVESLTKLIKGKA